MTTTVHAPADQTGDGPVLPDEPVATPTVSAVPVRDRTMGLVLVIGGVISFFAAFTLLLERFELAKDPDFVPSCNLNPILSCGDVMVTWQAALFHFPNPILGVAGFPAAIALGAVLLSGVTFAPWLRAATLAGVTLAAVFIGWLISQTIYSINALCPYCMVVWVCVIPMFWTAASWALDRSPLVQRSPRASAVVRVVVENRAVLIFLTYAAVLAMVGTHFWYYWKTLL